MIHSYNCKISPASQLLLKSESINFIRNLMCMISFKLKNALKTIILYFKNDSKKSIIHYI